MSVKSFFRRLSRRAEKSCTEPWDESKLLSRKWWLVASTVPLVILLDVFGSSLHDATLNFLQFVIVAYLGVQGAIDFFRYRERGRAKALADTAKTCIEETVYKVSETTTTEESSKPTIPE